MLPMSNADVHPGATETQQMRVIAPVGVSSCILVWVPAYNAMSLLQANVRLRLRIAYSVGGQPVQDQVDFAGFPPGLTSGSL